MEHTDNQPAAQPQDRNADTARLERMHELLDGNINLEDFNFPEHPQQFLAVELFNDSPMWAYNAADLERAAEYLEDSDTVRDGAQVFDLDTGHIYEPLMRVSDWICRTPLPEATHTHTIPAHRRFTTDSGYIVPADGWGIVVWNDEDLIQVLREKGFNDNEANIDRVKASHVIREMDEPMIERGWESIRFAVDDLAAELQTAVYYECQDCSGRWKEDELREIKDFVERHQPGDKVADGECPDCGALCFQVANAENPTT